MFNNRTGSNCVVVVTGAYPPDICGVGDYTSRLMAAAPPTWRLFVERNWSLPAAPGIVRRLLRLDPCDLVIQYPTQGYGWSIIPHLLIAVGWITRRYRSTIALHEFSSLSAKARLCLALGSHLASRVVFTTERERDAARAHRFFSSVVPTSVIGILSNIPSTSVPPAFADRATDIAYFGHIRPNKGLEDFLDVMTAFREAAGFARIAVVGEIPKGYESFAEQVEERCREIGCAMIVGLDDEATGRMLADIRILYLPFPDGVSARRGSVLAGMGNGAIVATTIGDATPPALVPALIVCSGMSEDVAILIGALALSAENASMLQMAGRDYMKTMLPRDWAHVAALYDDVIAAAPSSQITLAC